MDKCPFCDKELKHTAGRRKKKYCNKKCKQGFFNKIRTSEKPNYIKGYLYRFDGSSFVFESGGKLPSVGDRIAHTEIVKSVEKKDAIVLAGRPTQESILNQIKEIESEKIPKDRDTPLGRQVWTKEKQVKIKKLKSQLL